MGKIKSAIITAILIAAIVVLTFFATVSYTVPGSNGVKGYNSFISSIRLSGDLTGEAEALLYPDGVISAAYYSLLIATEDGDKRTEYEDKYTQRGSVYVEKDAIDKDGEDAFKAKVKSDAEVLSKRFGQKGYTSYSVSVQDDFTVKVSVPTNFSYAAYKGNNATVRSAETTKIEQTIKFLFYSGELSFRNSEVGKSGADNILTPIKTDVTTLIKSVTKYAAGGNYAVKLNLTKAGKKQFKEITEKVSMAEEDKAIGFYVGEDQLLSLNVSEVIESSSLLISIDNEGNSSDETKNATAQNYAIVLNSVAHGETLSLNYGTDDFNVVYTSSALGSKAPVYLGIAMLVLIVAAMVYSVIKYRLLGAVNSIMIALYSLTIVIALTVIEFQLTIAAAVMAVLGLALLCGSNFALFEEVRKETKKGKTMQSAIQSAYKNLLTGILETHVILLIASVFVAFVGIGELASCGLVLLFATVASYVLYWFTRFMWYVLSSPVRDKFKFGGFTREEQIDE